MEAEKNSFQDDPSTSAIKSERKNIEESQDCSKTKKTDEQEGTTQDNFVAPKSKRDIELLHESINGNNIKNIEKIIEKNIFDEHSFNDSCQSAVAASLKPFRPEIFEFLITHGFRLGTHEKIKKIAADEKVQREIFEIHKKCAIESHKNHITVLRSKCRLHINTPKNLEHEYFGVILNALEELDGTADEISILLEILSLSPGLRIFFDFNETSTNGIDPRDTNQTKGSFYRYSYDFNAFPPIFCITIGAKNLLDSVRKTEVLGTMAHELCHCVMSYLFDNLCKPYDKDDKEKADEFETIVENYKQKFNNSEIDEEIVKLAFECYDTDAWHSELIVRVPHMLAFYKGADEIIEQLRNEFSELFKFYDKLMPELERRMSVMKVEFEVKEINEICGLSTKLQKSIFNLKDDAIVKFQIDFESKDSQVFQSNCVELTLKSIYDKAKKLEKLKFLIFAKLENLENEVISKQIHEALEKHENVVAIIKCDETDSNTPADKIYEENRHKKIVCVTNKNLKINAIENEKVTHLMSELSDDSQKELLKTKVNFQGSKIELNEIWSTNLESIDTFPFDEMLRREEVQIGDKITFEETHVERKFQSRHESWNRNEAEISMTPLSTNEVISKTNNIRIFVLSDEPGNGKSTEFKILTMKLKQKLQNCWILLIDLKLHAKNLKKDPKTSEKDFDSVEKISDFLARKILKLKPFEDEIFSELFKNDRVVVLMDGVDEISPSYKKFVLELAVGIRKKSKNQLWMATRPHLVKELEEKLKTTAWVLTEFTNDDRKNFFEQIFKKNNLNFEEFHDKIEIFINDLEDDRRFRSYQRVTNPLLLHMIAELFIDNPNFQLQNSNLYKIYEEFVKKMFKRLLKKGSEADHDTTEFMTKTNIQKFYKKVAIENMFKTKFKSTEIKHLPQPSDDQLNRIGLMFNDGGDNFHFIHETFKEFFIAQTIFETIFDLKFHSEVELSETLDIMLEMMNHIIEYEVVLVFLDNALENFSLNQNCDKSKLLIAKIKKVENLKFIKSAEFGCNNLIKILSQLIDDKEKIFNLWMKMDWSSNTIQTAFKYQTLEKMQDLWSFAEKCFTDSQMKILITKNPQSEFGEMNCFSAAIHNEDERTFKFFLQLVDDKLNQDEKDSLISCSSINWIYICQCGNMKFVLSRLKKFFADKFKDYLENLKDDIKAFNQACYSENAESIKFLCSEIIEQFGHSEIPNVLRRTDQDGRNVLMNAAKKDRQPKVFETLINVIENKIEIKALLQQEDKDGQNVLMIAMLGFSTTELIKIVLKAYEDHFNIEELKKILVRENRRQENVLDIAANYDIDQFKVVFDFMEKVLNAEDLKKLLIKSLANIERWDLLELMPFIVETLAVDEYQIIFPVWLEAARFSEQKEIQQLLDSVDTQIDFADSFYKKLFEYIDANDKTMLDYAEENKNEKVFETLNAKKAKLNFASNSN